MFAIVLYLVIAVVFTGLTIESLVQLKRTRHIVYAIFAAMPIAALTVLAIAFMHFKPWLS